MKKEKILIAYYSRKGKNYYAGSIVDLPVGNTEVAAKKIQDITGGEMFQIETVKSYPEDYTETTKVAEKEMKEKARPELMETVTDMDTYDVVYLGYPNWWGTMPMAVYTFLESYDFSGKTIIPFCTHEGSGMGSSEWEIKTLCRKSKVLPGLAIQGSKAARADKEIQNWVRKSSW